MALRVGPMLVGGAFRPTAILLLLASLAPRQAHAGIEDSIGLGPRASALGGSYTARPGDFAAAYYNPAGLAPGGARVDPPGFSELVVGFVLGSPAVDVTTLDGEAMGVAASLPVTAGLLVGARLDLGYLFDVEGLSFGLALYLPTKFFRWSIHPDDSLQWLFLTDRTQRIAIDPAIGWRITPWLSVGAGLRVLFDVETLTYGRVTSVDTVTDPETGAVGLDVGTQLGEDVTVFGRVAPSVGLLFTASPALHFGLAYRAETLVDDWGYTRIQRVPGLGDLGYNHRFAHYFQPHQVTAAASYHLGATSFSADLTYQRWSAGLTTNRNTFGSGHFGDTWTPSVGLEWGVVPAVSVLCGYQYSRSPFDNFGGPTNLLDNDKHVASVGMTVGLGELLSLSSPELSLSWSFQLSFLVEREERKDFRRFASDEALESNPGYPGYRYGGVLPAGSLAVELGW